MTVMFRVGYYGNMAKIIEVKILLSGSHSNIMEVNNNVYLKIIKTLNN